MSDAAIARLAELGFDRDKGARPLKHTVEERVIVPLAALLAERPHLRDQKAHVRTATEPAPRPEGTRGDLENGAPRPEGTRGDLENGAPRPEGTRGDLENGALSIVVP
ncbi:MAG: hypothetical protein U0271_26525 [Polyangiaceae bacterium]